MSDLLIKSLLTNFGIHTIAHETGVTQFKVLDIKTDKGSDEKDKDFAVEFVHLAAEEGRKFNESLEHALEKVKEKLNVIFSIVRIRQEDKLKNEKILDLLSSGFTIHKIENETIILSKKL